MVPADLPGPDAGDAAGHGEWRSADVDLAALARQAADITSPLLAARGAALALDLPDRLPMLRAAPDRLQQVLLNLLSNAAKVVPSPGGEVRLRLWGDADGAHLAVQDNGPGVPAGQRALIFERFRQGGSADHRPGPAARPADERPPPETYGLSLFGQQDSGHVLDSRPLASLVCTVFDTVLVAHNAAFDLAFLQGPARAAGLRFDQPVVDTLLLSSVVHPDADSHALEAVAAQRGVPAQGRHTALGDALVTAEVLLLLRLLPLAAGMGLQTLGQVRAGGQASPLATTRV